MLSLFTFVDLLLTLELLVLCFGFCFLHHWFNSCQKQLNATAKSQDSSNFNLEVRNSPNLSQKVKFVQVLINKFETIVRQAPFTV